MTHPKAEYADEPMDEARCPECGNEDGNYSAEAQNGWTQPVPFEQRGRCPEGEHSDSPLAFHHEYRWHRMGEKERAEAERKRARMEDAMSDYQYSAHYLSMQKEP